MMRRAPTTLAGLVVAFVAIGCTSTSPTPSPSAVEGSPVASPGTDVGLIPQPEPPGDLEVAPDDQRVDLNMPNFSNPTEVTNPLFPVSDQQSVLLTGIVDDQAFRTEVTLLPTTRVLQWEGHEVAYDLDAQADDGSVWYFGEDVFNFADGAIVDTHGTWIAGVDGPAAMIMPAEPQVGDVYRPENIPGFVFEEVTVKQVEQTLDSPLRQVQGGLSVEELHM